MTDTARQPQRGVIERLPGGAFLHDGGLDFLGSERHALDVIQQCPQIGFGFLRITLEVERKDELVTGSTESKGGRNNCRAVVILE
ncbi:hypothetical protein D9M71_701730 [compost metagenome]